MWRLSSRGVRQPRGVHDEGVLRVAVGRRAGIDEDIDQLDLDAALLRDPGPRHQLKGVIELLAQTVAGFTFRGLDDRARDLGDVPGQLAIPHWILGHEPEKVRPLEESIEGAADLVAQPSTG